MNVIDYRQANGDESAEENESSFAIGAFNSSISKEQIEGSLYRMTIR
jgi:hypothetical protein